MFFDTPAGFLVVAGLFAFVFGAIFGSFGNVLIFRLPNGESIGGRSKDKHTGKTLQWWELFPILSFIFLGGRSRYSKKPLSWQYPIVETISGLLFVYALLFTPYSWLAKGVLALSLWGFLLIAVVDARTQTIPDSLNVPVLVLSGIFAFLIGRFDPIALAISVGFLGIQWLMSGGRWIGSGDIILIASMALLIGEWKQMLLCILLAYVIGSVVALTLIAAGKKTRRDAIAFAPFLIMSTFITFAWGADILFALYGI